MRAWPRPTALPGASPHTVLASEKTRLLAALNDEDSAVRLSTARALLNADADSKTQALRKLAKLVVETSFSRERNAAIFRIPPAASTRPGWCT